MDADFRNKRVLVTGASGFIGSHLTRRMVQERALVTVYVRESSDLWRMEGVRDWIEVCRGDIGDPIQTEACLARVKPDYVFHMAAYGVDARQKDWSQAAQTNILGVINLMSALRKLGCIKVLNIGSCMEYGVKEDMIQEDEVLQPFNIYGSTKASATILAHQLAGASGIDIVTLRAFGIFGENEGSHKFFPHIILANLMGRDVSLTGCEQYRDYCYIDNLMDAFVLAALDDGCQNEIFNVGSGSIHQLRYYVNLVTQYMPRAKAPKYGAIPYRPDEVWKPYPDTGKIRARLHWTPTIGLEEGLIRTINWYEANLSQYIGTGR